METLLKTLASGVTPLLAIALVFLAYRHNMKKWRSKIDAELQAALSGLGVDCYTLIVDKLTSPSTNRTADVYRILHDDQDRYYLFIKTGEHPGVLKPLPKERALSAAKMHG
ncbi:hypothetical protein [Pseudomonas sp. DC418]|uniref:hypothetical protein n=1 Tax=Pseudomonas sp. DC418 TaxID=3418478 RepID=UPI003D2A852D